MCRHFTQVWPLYQKFESKFCKVRKTAENNCKRQLHTQGKVKNSR